MFMLAEDVRSYMAKLGFRTYKEMVGHTDKLVFSPSTPKAKLLDFNPILTNAMEMRPDVNTQGGSLPQLFALEKKLVRFVISWYYV